MDRWQAIKVFLKVAEAGGFAEAARQLGQSAPAVTRAVASLEAALGARLFVRTTRAVSLTEAGQQYARDCQRIVAELAEADALAAGAYLKPTGTLSVTAPVMFGHQYVLPILTDYLARYPAVKGRTLFVDRLTQLVDEGIDVAVRIGHLPDSELRAIPVGSVRRVICASPDYLARQGVPGHPDDLAGHVIVAATGAWASPEWRFGEDGKTRVTVQPRWLCNTNEAAISAAIAGAGLTRVLSYQVAGDVAANRLCIVLADFEEPALPIHFVHAEGRRADAKVRAFLELAVERLRGHPLLA